MNAAWAGRVASQSAKAQASRADTQHSHNAARRRWAQSDQPAWLDEETYVQRIQPLLPSVSGWAIARTLGVSRAYAADIRRGKRRPHPRHWQALAQLVGVSADDGQHHRQRHLAHDQSALQASPGRARRPLSTGLDGEGQVLPGSYQRWSEAEDQAG